VRLRLTPRGAASIPGPPLFFIYHFVTAPAQDEAEGEAPLDAATREARLPAQLIKLARAEAAQDGERAVFAYQAIMEEEAATGREEIIGERMAMKVVSITPSARSSRIISKTSRSSIS